MESLNFVLKSALYWFELKRQVPTEVSWPKRGFNQIPKIVLEDLKQIPIGIAIALQCPLPDTNETIIKMSFFQISPKSVFRSVLPIRKAPLLKGSGNCFTFKCYHKLETTRANILPEQMLR